MEERNCAFQYAKITGQIFQDTKIVEDKSELTLSQAKELWNKHYPDLFNNIKNGDSGEMAIWINMADSSSYGETLEHISTNAEILDGYIVERSIKYFPKLLK